MLQFSSFPHIPRQNTKCGSLCSLRSSDDPAQVWFHCNFKWGQLDFGFRTNRAPPLSRSSRWIAFGVRVARSHNVSRLGRSFFPHTTPVNSALSEVPFATPASEEEGKLRRDRRALVNARGPPAVPGRPSICAISELNARRPSPSDPRRTRLVATTLTPCPKVKDLGTDWPQIRSAYLACYRAGLQRFL
jgi:hypothetical protein